MSDLLSGGGVGIAFDLLMQAVLHVTFTVASFRPILNHLNSTLLSIKPFVMDIEKLKRVLDDRQEEADTLTKRLNDGVLLVRKCQKVQWWDAYRKYRYAKKLEEFEGSLLWFFQINVQAEMFRDGKVTVSGIKVLDEKMDKVLSVIENGGSGNSKGFSGWSGVPGVPSFVVGLEVPLQELKAMLLTDGVPLVVLSAPGGSGKTTLAKMLSNDEKIKGTFGSNIFFQTVSRTPNLQLIVQKIFQSKRNLGLPNFQSDEDAINQLEHFFQQHMRPDPVLLVLDDMWSGSEALIEQFLFPNIQGYKILVTSRFVFPRFESTYKLNVLNHQDAVTLFTHSAFKDGICNVKKHLVDEVVRGCSGSPLALTVVGKSLYRQAEVKWISTVQNWSQGKSIYDTNIDLLGRLKTSLDAMDEMGDLKNCFLDLGSFPEDQKIPTAALLDMWVELYDLDEGGMYALGNLHELSNRNLVDLTLIREYAQDAIDYCNEHFVTQHDLLRELAIHHNRQEPIKRRERLNVEINGNSFPKWWTEQKQELFNARVLSISTDNDFCSNWLNVQVPDVEVLILNFRTKIYTLPQFMEKMSRLTVLIVMNYGVSLANLKNFPQPNQCINLKRVRLEHISFPSIATSILHLHNLQKISLIMCEIGNAFEVGTIEISNPWPNLKEINIGYCDDLIELPAWFCCLVQLKKLSLSYCQELVSLPAELGNLTNLEMLRLQSCTSLLELPESISRLHKLRFLDLSDCIEMESMPMQLGELCSLRKICMMGCRGLYELPPSAVNLVQLECVICDEEIGYLWEVYKGYLQKLEIRVVKEDINLNWLHKIPA